MIYVFVYVMLQERKPILSDFKQIVLKLCCLSSWVVIYGFCIDLFGYLASSMLSA